MFSNNYFNKYVLSKFHNYSNYKSMYYIGLDYIGYIEGNWIETYVTTQWKYHTRCSRQPSYVQTNEKYIILK